MINPLDMSGRTVLVTGASSGIGRETAVLLAELGARVVLVARNRERLDATSASLAGQGHQVELFELTESDAIPVWMKGLADRLGPLHGVVHCAGITMPVPIRSWTSAATSKILDINLYPCFGLARGFRQRGVHGPGASLVFVSSTAGLAGSSSLSSYAASKGAVISLTRGIAMELVRDEIRVNCVAPALVDTEMLDAGRQLLTHEQHAALINLHPLGIGKPRDVANSIVFLLAGTARWITGSTLVVDGGMTAQ